MKKELLMCNYMAMCDSTGTVMGHTMKVTKEYYRLLKQRYEVSLLAVPCVIEDTGSSEIASKRSLRDQIVTDRPFTLKRRIADKLLLIRNLKDCFAAPERDLFFYQVDFFFFFYLWLFYHPGKKMQKTPGKCVGSPRHRVYCLIYHQDFTGGSLAPVLQSIYRKGLRKMDGVIYTQKGHPVDHPNTFWMPDYLYDPEQYDALRALPKENRMICLGTMNRYKQLEELVAAVAAMEQAPMLSIIGRFDDAQRYKNLKKLVSLVGKENEISVEDRAPGAEEYYHLLATSRYSVLPYEMSQYVNRTSGVLLESIYVGSIPIAPKQLLSQNELPGMGYDLAEELAGGLRIGDAEAEQKILTQMNLVVEQNTEQAVLEQFETLLK